LCPNLNISQPIQEKIKYIQKVNTEIGMKKGKEWLSIVNQHNIFLEIYERKIMNPNMIQTKEDTNPDIFWQNYLQYL
jgi:hypothetical protein